MATTRKARKKKTAPKARRRHVEVPPWRERFDRLKQEVARARVVAAKKLHAARERSPHVLGVVMLAVLQFCLIVTAPFLVLVRGAIWLYQGYGVPSWAALMLSGWATLMLLALYGAVLSRQFTGRARLWLVARWVAAPLVIGYCAYTLLYLSRVNAKDDDVRAFYTTTHPLLRVALSTLILADRNAVVTDLARTPDDYRRMGLAINQRSMHYRQADGWVHAVDLRTRGSLENLLVEWYFLAMGFDTMRHVGTSDHIHVQLTVGR